MFFVKLFELKPFSWYNNIEILMNATSYKSQNGSPKQHPSKNFNNEQNKDDAPQQDRQKKQERQQYFDNTQ